MNQDDGPELGWFILVFRQSSYQLGWLAFLLGLNCIFSNIWGISSWRSSWSSYWIILASSWSFGSGDSFAHHPSGSQTIILVSHIPKGFFFFHLHHPGFILVHEPGQKSQHSVVIRESGMIGAARMIILVTRMIEQGVIKTSKQSYICLAKLAASHFVFHQSSWHHPGLLGMNSFCSSS